MDILVVGGTYFAGKAFVELAQKEHNVTVLNRGTRSGQLFGVNEVRADRHDVAGLKTCGLQGQKFDAVVDFCAYASGDIQGFLKAGGMETKQYIFISTCDVYPHDVSHMIKEEESFEDKKYPGPEGEYIAGKVALEKELQETASSNRLHYTSLRPAFIYGPHNYAGREMFYFQWISQTGQFLHPIDATGHFQLTYVKDLARAILLCVGNEKAYDKAFNVCPQELIDYKRFADILMRISDRPTERVDITMELVCKKQIPLPFPLLSEESHQYDGSYIERELGFHYSDFEIGMKETYQWFLENAKE